MAKHKHHEQKEDEPQLATGELADEVMEEAAKNGGRPVPRGEVEEQEEEEEQEAPEAAPENPLPGDAVLIDGFPAPSQPLPVGVSMPLGGYASPAVCPVNGGEHGDKHRDVFIWHCQNTPLEAACKKYVGRKVEGRLVTEALVKQVASAKQ